MNFFVFLIIAFFSLHMKHVQAVSGIPMVMLTLLGTWGETLAAEPQSEDYQRQHFECKSIFYVYAPIFGELSCPPKCTGNTHGTHENCPTNRVKQICQDGVSDSRNCDPVVFVNKQNNTNKDNIVPWVFKDHTYRAFYYNHWTADLGTIQYVYSVQDTNVPASQCGSLKINVEDRNNQGVDPSEITDGFQDLKIPLNPNIVEATTGHIYQLTKYFTTSENCGSNNKYVDDTIKYKVVLAVGVMEYTPSDGDRVCNTGSKFYNCETKELKLEKVKEAVKRVVKAHASEYPGEVKYGKHEDYSAAEH